MLTSSFRTSPSTHQYVLTEEQRRMYASEKLENFRWISKLVATYSGSTLTDSNLASEAIYKEVAELGQFAELAYSAVPIPFLVSNLEKLSQPHFPLEGYDALHDCVLVDSFSGSCADLPGYVAYRPESRQLVVSISGTSSMKQAIQDLRSVRKAHPSGRGTVHTGFFALYQGLLPLVMPIIKKGLVDHSPTELVLTGHSMGGSVAYLLCIDLLADENCLPPGLKLKIVVFGSPRSGDANLVEYFHSLVDLARPRLGNDFFTEYAVKGYNDGVPALPPAFLGYRHFCKEPLYTVGGKLYRTPASESEHALFRVESDSNPENDVRLFPKGGHNYYNGRDLEKFARRINWLDKSKPTMEGWEERYLSIVTQ